MFSFGKVAEIERLKEELRLSGIVNLNLKMQLESFKKSAMIASIEVTRTQNIFTLVRDGQPFTICTRRDMSDNVTKWRKKAGV